MAMVQTECMRPMEGQQFLAEDDYKPIIFECFSTLDELQRSFGGVGMHPVDGRGLSDEVRCDLERVGLLKVMGDEMLRLKLRRDVCRKKKTGILDEDLIQPSKGKIYGRKFNGRFASKAIYNYHNKKKALGGVDMCDDERNFKENFEGVNSSSYEEEEFTDMARDVVSESPGEAERTRTCIDFDQIDSETTSKTHPSINQSFKNQLPSMQSFPDQSLNKDDALTLSLCVPEAPPSAVAPTQSTLKPARKRQAKKHKEVREKGLLVVMSGAFVEQALMAYDHSPSEPATPVQPKKNKEVQLNSDDELISCMKDLKADDQTEYDPNLEEPYPSLPPTPLPLTCPLASCRLGCICQTLKVRSQFLKVTHCGNNQCMLSCQCQHMTRSRASKFGTSEMFVCPLSPRMKLNVNTHQHPTNYQPILSPTRTKFQEHVVSVASKEMFAVKKVTQAVERSSRRQKFAKKKDCLKDSPKIAKSQTSAKNNSKKSEDLLEISSESEGESSSSSKRLKLSLEDGGKETPESIKLLKAGKNDNKLSGNKLSSNKLTNNKLTNDKLTTNKLTSNKLTNNKLTTNKLTNNKLTNNKLTNNKLTNNKLINNKLTKKTLQSNQNTNDTNNNTNLNNSSEKLASSNANNNNNNNNNNNMKLNNNKNNNNNNNMQLNNNKNVKNNIVNSTNINNDNNHDTNNTANNAVNNSNNSTNNSTNNTVNNSNNSNNTVNNSTNNSHRKPVMYLVRKKMRIGGSEVEKTLLIEAYSQSQWSNYKRRLSNVLFECVFVRGLLKDGPYVLRFEHFKLRVMQQHSSKSGYLNNIKINNIKIDNVNTVYIKVFIYLLAPLLPNPTLHNEPIVIPDSPVRVCESSLDEAVPHEGEGGRDDGMGTLNNQVNQKDEVGCGDGDSEINKDKNASVDTEKKTKEIVINNVGEKGVEGTDSAEKDEIDGESCREEEEMMEGCARTNYHRPPTIKPSRETKDIDVPVDECIFVVNDENEKIGHENELDSGHSKGESSILSNSKTFSGLARFSYKFHSKESSLLSDDLRSPPFSQDIYPKPSYRKFTSPIKLLPGKIMNMTPNIHIDLAPKLTDPEAICIDVGPCVDQPISESTLIEEDQGMKKIFDGLNVPNPPSNSASPPLYVAPFNKFNPTSKQATSLLSATTTPIPSASSFLSTTISNNSHERITILLSKKSPSNTLKSSPITSVSKTVLSTTSTKVVSPSTTTIDQPQFKSFTNSKMINQSAIQESNQPVSSSPSPRAIPPNHQLNCNSQNIGKLLKKTIVLQKTPILQPNVKFIVGPTVTIIKTSPISIVDKSNKLTKSIVPLKIKHSQLHSSILKLAEIGGAKTLSQSGANKSPDPSSLPTSFNPMLNLTSPPFIQLSPNTLLKPLSLSPILQRSDIKFTASLSEESSIMSTSSVSTSTPQLLTPQGNSKDEIDALIEIKDSDDEESTSSFKNNMATVKTVRDDVAYRIVNGCDENITDIVKNCGDDVFEKYDNLKGGVGKDADRNRDISPEVMKGEESKGMDYGSDVSVKMGGNGSSFEDSKVMIECESDSKQEENNNLNNINIDKTTNKLTQIKI